jgi:tetratricopeptide (TPR) repeat protein
MQSARCPEIEKYPEDAEGQFLYAAALLLSDRYAEAVAPFERVLQVEPHNERASLGLFHSLWKMERCREALPGNPLDPRARSVLRRVFNLLMEHMEAIGQGAIDLPGDFYWDVPAEALYDPYSEPEQLNLGQLSEDWAKLRSLASGETPPVGYALVWLASVLRACGQSALR